jgi:hypothetical protein
MGNYDSGEETMNYDTRTTHKDSLHARFHFGDKCLIVQPIHLDIDHGSNEPTNVESGLGKIQIVGYGFRYKRGSPRKIFGLRMSRVATNRIFAIRTDSMRRVVWWSSLGGLRLNRFKTWRILHITQA